LPDIPKREIIYQITIKHTKWTQNKPNSIKIDLMVLGIIYQYLPFARPFQNLPKPVFLVLKI
jgi:hypothetical protein